MLTRDLGSYLDIIPHYAELRLQKNIVTFINMQKGNLVKNQKVTTEGVSCRTLNQGAWGFCSLSSTNKEAVKKAILQSKENANYLGSYKKSELNLKSFNKELNKSYKTHRQPVSQKQKVDFLAEIDSYIEKKYSDLKSRTVGFVSHSFEKNFINSDGAIAKSFLPRSLFICDLGLDKEGKTISYYDFFGGLGEYEDQFENPEKLYSFIDDCYELVKTKKQGILPEPGTHDVILGADVTGILAHEAVGHTTEADLVLGGSVAGDLLDKKVASEKVTLVDFAHHALGKECPVPIYIDDEGTPAEDVRIIEQGILKSFMHNKESAAHFDVQPCGNARAFDFNDEPLIRMRNTAILPGQEKLEDLIASIDNGYYFTKTTNGQADTTGEFMFGVSMGYEIKKGKIARPLLDSTISGVAFEMLKTVEGVSDQFNWASGGFCGKKQPMIVGFGGPDIKCKVNVGG